MFMSNTNDLNSDRVHGASPIGFSTAAATDFMANDEPAGANAMCTNETQHSPTFRVYYNDVYEVNLPPRHRFPMGKYRKVRERVQKLISSLPDEEQETVNCGE